MDSIPSTSRGISGKSSKDKKIAKKEMDYSCKQSNDRAYPTYGSYNGKFDANYDHEYDQDMPDDYYCMVCKASMNSDLTWSMHVSGQRHQKKMAAASFGVERRIYAPPDAELQQIKISGGLLLPTKKTNEVAQIQRQIEGIRDKVFVGLDFVTEIWRREKLLEPLYHCKLCDSDCQQITIIAHIIGHRHRMNYIKLKNPEKYEAFNKSTCRKSIVNGMVSHYARRLEGRFGRGIVQCAVEVEGKYETDSNADLTDTPMELEPPIQSVQDGELRKKFLQSSRSKRNNVLAKVPTVETSKVLQSSSMAERMKKLQRDIFKSHINAMTAEEQLKIGDEFMKGDFTFLKEYQQNMLNLKQVKKVLASK